MSNERKKKKQTNVNESYLDDISYSVYIEKKHNEKKPDKREPLEHTLPRQTRSWVEDSTVIECQNCSAKFTMFLRKHHCRLCGKIYCHECSKYRDLIPDTILSEQSINGTWSDYLGSYIYMTDISRHRVCVGCHKLIEKVFSIKKVIEVFIVMKLDLNDLKKAGKVCKTWLNASNYCLSKFREIQYKLPNEPYIQLEIDMAWNNLKYIQGHNKYLLHLIKMCENDLQIEKVRTILDKPRLVDCRTTMCCRNCEEKLNSFDAINILDYSFKSVPYSKLLKRLAVKYLVCGDKEFKCYIPYLVYNIRNDSYGVITDFLLERCLRNFSLLNALYWELQLYPQSCYQSSVYAILSRRLKMLISDERLQERFMRLLQGNKFIKLVEDISQSICEDNQSYDELKDNFHFNKETILPLNPEIVVNGIQLNKIKIKNSATKPIIIPCESSDGSVYRIMHKNEDVRKDQIIMNIIYLIEMVVKKEEGLDLEIVKYNVLPTGKNTGLIEIVEDADTIYFIQEKLDSSILNYMMENNDDILVKELRTRFIKSVAAYCVITYLLGIGDRHLDNIMITRDGRLFHVDFGYILGMDPVFNNPGIRITKDVVDAIGGLSSKYYVEFKELSSKIYNCLRRNIDIFMHMLFLIPNISDLNLSEDLIRQQIITRFKPGENSVDAKMHLVQQLERYNYTDKIKDWCHYYSKEKTISSAMSRLTFAISGLWNPNS